MSTKCPASKWQIEATSVSPRVTGPYCRVRKILKLRAGSAIEPRVIRYRPPGSGGGEGIVCVFLVRYLGWGDLSGARPGFSGGGLPRGWVSHGMHWVQMS